MCDKLVELDRYFAKWALEEEKRNLIQDFLPDGRYGKSNICRKSMAQIGEYGPYGDQGNAIYGACARILDTCGSIVGKSYSCGFLGVYPSNGVGDKPKAAVELWGDQLLGEALEAIWGLDKALQHGWALPECMAEIMRACGETPDRRAVHNYVRKMNKAVLEWGDRAWHDWVNVEPECKLQWKNKNCGRLAAAFFDLQARATATDMSCSSALWSPQSQSAATEHASKSKKQLRKRDAGHQIDVDAIRRKRIVGSHPTETHGDTWEAPAQWQWHGDTWQAPAQWQWQRHEH
ncbi:MAG: hypothetical protein MK077_10720 [Phycisphaerales bacterium]|nr:hypothetical protein [Phycisphaerales bacterium]